MSAMKYAVLWSMGVICALSTAAEAHMRDHLFSQEYYTAKRGEIELEFFNDVRFGDVDNSDTYSSKHQIELEYGITNRLMMALYAVWKWEDGSDIFYDEWKAELKYRFFEVDILPIDLALYAEYHNTNGSPPDDSDKIELKLIGSKSWGRWNITANWIMEKEIQNANKMEFAWTAGVSYAWTPRLKTGLEFKETLGDADEFGWHRKSHKVQLMPTIGWSPTRNSKILIGPAFGLTRPADDIELRTMVAIEF